MGGRLSAVSAIRDATETLAACGEGYSVLVPFSLEQDMAGSTYPIYLVSVGTCVMHATVLED